MSPLYQRNLSVKAFTESFQIAIQVSLLLFQMEKFRNISKFKNNQKNPMFYKYGKATFPIS